MWYVFYVYMYVYFFFINRRSIHSSGCYYLDYHLTFLVLCLIDCLFCFNEDSKVEAVYVFVCVAFPFQYQVVVLCLVVLTCFVLRSSSLIVAEYLSDISLWGMIVYLILGIILCYGTCILVSYRLRSW